MKDLIEDLIYFIVKKLVLNPEAINIEKEVKETDNTVCYKVKVASNDMCRVIGKQGRIAKSIRNVVKSAALKNNLKVLIDIG